jgi:hypothetical protein
MILSFFKNQAIEQLNHFSTFSDRPKSILQFVYWIYKYITE